MQRITKLTVRIKLWILSQGSDQQNKKKFAFHLLLKAYFKVGMKRKLRLSFFLYCDVYPSATASEMRGRDLISSFGN